MSRFEPVTSNNPQWGTPPLRRLLATYDATGNNVDQHGYGHKLPMAERQNEGHVHLTVHMNTRVLDFVSNLRKVDLGLLI